MNKKWLRLGAGLIAGALLVTTAAACSDDSDDAVEAGGEDPPVPFDLDAKSDIGLVFQAWASPMQEGGDEQDTPEGTPSQFLSTEPSVDRAKRPDNGQAVLTFSNDLSTAYFYMQVADVNLSQLNMLHLHCGRPGYLGPIGVDFSLVDPIEDIAAALEDGGVYRAEITDKLIVETSGGGAMGKDVVAAFTSGCPIYNNPDDLMSTVGGLAYIANQGDIYVNLHTTAQTYFGDIRGQFSPVDENDDDDD